MKKLFILFLLLSSVSVSTFGQIDEQRLTEPYFFGNDVAISGNWCIVGNRMDSYTANGGITYSAAGSASIFKKQANGVWQFHSKLIEQCWYTGGDQHGNYFGHSVAMDGNWAVVGSDYDSDDAGNIGPDGVVFVYHYNAGLNAWILYQRLSGPLFPDHFFGYDVSVKGNLMAISDPFCSTGNQGGRIYTYRLNQATGLWEPETSLVAGIGNDNDYFGASVSVASDIILVGAPEKGADNQGGAYLFRYDGGVYTETAFQQPSPQNLDKFGYSTAINGDFMMIGCPGTPGSVNAAGKSFTYKRNAATGQWSLLQTLVPADNQDGDAFGSAVAIGSRDEEIYFAATAPLWDGLANNENSRGAAYLFRFNTNSQSWTNSTLLSSDGTAEDQYGTALCFDQGTSCESMAVTALSVDLSPQGVSYGAAYLYSLLPSTLGIWTGVADNLWSNPANWSDNLVPNGASDVTIAAGLTTYPRVDGLAFCRNLTIAAGATIELDDAAELRILGDLQLLGQFLFSNPENKYLPQLHVGGDAAFYCDSNKWLPGGEYNGNLKINASSLSYKLTMAGDVKIYDQLVFQHSTRGQLHIADRTLTLYDLIGGLNSNGLYSTRYSSLILTGNPPIAFDLSRNIREINNLTVDISKGVGWITANSLEVFGVLTLLKGNFNIIGNNGNPASLTLYHSVAGNGNLFKPTPGDMGSSLIIMGDEVGFQLPTGLTTIDWLMILNPNTVTMNADLYVEGYLYLVAGQLNTNGYTVSYGPDGQLWSASFLEVTEGLIDPDHQPFRVWVRGNQLLFNMNGEIDDLMVDGVSQGFTLAAGRELTVGSTENINQKLHLDASSAGNASFIDQPADRKDIEAEVENYLSSGKWHLVSSPVTGARASAFYFPGASPTWLKYFNEATGNWVYINSLEEDLIPGKGYAVWVDSDKSDETATYDGLLNRSDLLVNLEYSGPINGWNLVGNPFSSALDWDVAGWNHQNTTGIAYVWNNGNYLTRNQIGQGTLPNGIIPSGQGFFVQATASNANLTMPVNARVHQSSTFYKDANPTFEDALDISVEINGKSDKTWIGFDEAASDEMDKDLDALRLDGSADMPALMTKIGDKRISINMLEPINQSVTIPLYFTNPVPGLAIIGFGYVNSFVNTTLILVDRLTGDRIDLNETSTYQFDYAPSDPEHRFDLVFNRQTTALPDPVCDHDYRIFIEKGLVKIAKIHENDAVFCVSVSDATGRLLDIVQSNHSCCAEINTTAWANQMLLLTIMEENEQISIKVVTK